MCVYSPSYPACKAYVLYYVVICGLYRATLFLLFISQKRNDSQENVTEHKM